MKNHHFWLIFSLICSSFCLDPHRYYENFILPPDPTSPPDSAATQDCFRSDGSPQRCVPQFINAAFNREVVASNTCGTKTPTEFYNYVQNKKVYGVCDSRIPTHNHPPEYLTDFNNPQNETWWQSETMMEGVQYPNNVTLTLHFGKTFDITYVRIKFMSPRPESFTIYKKTTADGEWIPWQYYSASCKSTYKMPEKAPILPGNEDVAQCTRDFSDISPLTGGNIAFSTLEGRPSAENFEESEVLQEWVTASGIRIVLNRLNTFGDEVFRDPRVLKSYYYAISDLTVGGRCKCNGHASACVASNGENVGETLVCDCQHNTEGSDCQQCKPFFQDRPWRRATAEDANECLPCNCNGLSSRCYFDQRLFDATGKGGHCLDCTGNTHGPHCEFCLPEFYRPENVHFCVECDCNKEGSKSQQCDANGQCECKPGVTGARCDQCEAGFYDFSSSGCKDCHCEVAGSWDNQPRCSPISGECQCKKNVEGQKCDKCKPGYFNLSPKNQFGCTPCFCFGHSSVCSAAEGFFATNVTSDFLEGIEKWTAASERRLEDVQWAQIDNEIAVSQVDHYPVYFHVPAEFLGDLRSVFNHEISFEFRTHLEATAASNKDLIIVSGNGKELTTPITAQGNPLPLELVQRFRFKLHPSASDAQWSPNLSEVEFIGRLVNVTAIKIRGTYSKGDVGFLTSFVFPKVTRSRADVVTLNDADWIEDCSCPVGHVGQFCESCAPGYRRAVKFGGPLTKCIKCDCHGHSDSCDAESGACICQHNTAGDTCESCARGFYGNALNGTENDCQKCDCPENGPCTVLAEGGTVCTECPIGYAGQKCELCADEYYGNPSKGEVCLPCICNGNIDENAIGNCDRQSGECKKCIFNTTGFNCEFCLPGFYGNATAERRNECKECACYPPGTRKRYSQTDLECDQESGQCDCLPHVTGQRCDQCEPGFFNITSGKGCTSCECDLLGSEDLFCDVFTGKCKCKPGVTGLKCDQCAARFYGSPAQGCKPCDCDVTGSESADCDVATGQCLCKDNVEGRRCDQCSENRFNMRAGCLPCDDCYTLIQTRKNDLENKIREAENALDYWENNNVTVDDDSVRIQVENLQKDLDDFLEKMGDYLDEESKKNIKTLLSRPPRMEKALKKLQNHRPVLQQMYETVEEMNFNFNEFDKVQSLYFTNFKEDVERVEREGTRWLAKAEENRKKNRQSSDELFAMATEADQIARKQRKMKQEILRKSTEARENIRKSVKEAEETSFGDKKSPKIVELEKMTDETAALLNKTKALLKLSSEETEKIYTEAARALAYARDIKVPKYDIEAFKANLTRARQNTASGQEQFRELTKKQQEMQRLARNLTGIAQQQYLKLEKINQEKKATLDRIEAQRNKTEAAVKDLQNSVEEAKKILYDVENFETNSKEQKEKLDQELELVEGTRNTIVEAHKRTIEARNGIGGSREIVQKALKSALEAQTQAELLETQTNQIAEAVDALTQSLLDSAEQFKKLDEVTETAEKVNEATKKMEAIRQETLALTKQAAMLELRARNGNKTLNGIEDELETLKERVSSEKEPPSEEDLKRLEAALDKAESELRMKKVKRATKLLRRNSLEKQRDQIKAEFVQVEQQLAELRDIYNALPSKCFNFVTLEQTDTSINTA